MKDVKITMDNEEILQKNLIEFDTKYKQLQKTYNDLLEEKKGFQGQLNILRSQKNVYLKEYNKNKDLITNLKTTNEILNKERDEFKRQRDIYKNEIEIIKKNNDKMNTIKLNNDIKAHSNQKLREAMNNLITEKNNIEKKCDVLQKRIEDIDKEKIRSRSIPRKKVLAKPKTFKNLKQISNEKLTILKGELKRDNSKIINNKSKPVKKNKKKFQKLSIVKNTVNVTLISKIKKQPKKQIKKEPKKDEIKNKEEIMNNKKEIDELMSKIMEKENKIKSLENKISDLTKKNKEYKETIEKIKKEKNKAKNSAQEELDKIQQEKDTQINNLKK